MTPEELYNEVTLLKSEVEDLRFLITRKLGLGSADIKGKIVSPSSVTVTLGANTVNQAAMADSAVGNAEWKYEAVTLAFSSGDTSKTATVTSGSTIIAVYESVVTSTPAQGELQLSVSGTTLTGTRSASPGGAAAITYTVTLLKA